MRQINKLFIALLLFAFLTIQTAEKSPAEQNYPFFGKINADNINVRADSTVSAAVICKLNKGDGVEVLSESYGWYKIKLPKTTPSFIKSDLADPLDDKTARILKNSVNIRLEPDESSLILGRVEKEEIINILEKTGDWYRIEPVGNSFAWVNNKFVDTDSLEISAPDNQAPKSIIVEGIIKSYGKVFKRQATHKLISQDNQVFLLKGNKETLDALNGRRVKVSGKLITPTPESPAIHRGDESLSGSEFRPPKERRNSKEEKPRDLSRGVFTAAQQKYPVIEVEKIIAQNEQDKNNESVN